MSARTVFAVAGVAILSIVAAFASNREANLPPQNGHLVKMFNENCTRDKPRCYVLLKSGEPIEAISTGQETAQIVRRMSITPSPMTLREMFDGNPFGEKALVLPESPNRSVVARAHILGDTIRQ